MTDTLQQEPILTLEPPLRLYHLSGGLALLAASNRICALMSPAGPGLSFFSPLGAESIPLGVDASAPIRAIGFTRFDAAEEMQDAIASNFAIAAPNTNDRCFAQTQSFHWSGVGTALHGIGRGSDALLATRINSQIRHCLTRLERLSNAYRTVLIAAKPPRPSIISYISDKYAQHLGSEYRSLLNELYSLRDALLVALYRLRYGRTEPFTIKKLKTVVASEISGVGKLVADSMFSAEGDLLIDHMSLYRSIAQHCIGTTHPIFGDMYRVMVSSSCYGQLPFIVYPLYDDIERMRSIEQGSSKGLFDAPPRAEAERFLSIPSHLDALEFCYDCFVRLLEISRGLAAEIGIEPRPVVITEKEILEATFTDGQGNTTRLKRDNATGRLVNVDLQGG